MTTETTFTPSKTDGMVWNCSLCGKDLKRDIAKSVFGMTVVDRDGFNVCPDGSDHVVRLVRY